MMVIECCFGSTVTKLLTRRKASEIHVRVDPRTYMPPSKKNNESSETTV